MSRIKSAPSAEEMKEFQNLIEIHRYDYVKLAYLIFRFGEPGTEMEDIHPYDWQIAEWEKMSAHFSNPVTRYNIYKLIVSSGNGAAKTAFGAMTTIMMMYTQRVRGRVTANTKPQLTTVVWPEYDIWFHRARYSEIFFEKLGESLKARNEAIAETWRMDTFVWNDATPAAVSGLHNKGGMIIYTFEEAPGIPAIIWKYASGAFTDVGTMKLWMAFGNSDDPESQFEQYMTHSGWRSLRIDTRTLDHVDKNQIAEWLKDCGGDEDHDDFRVRVRGMARKVAKDSIIKLHNVDKAIADGETFDPGTIPQEVPVVLTCDPAWQGGDCTVIWMHRGYYSRMLEKYKLDKLLGEDHKKTYDKLCEWEHRLGADAVLIDQGEGTAIKTLANMHGKHHWELISFANSPNDALEFKDSQYQNMRAQMYYEADTWLAGGGVITARDPEWLDEIRKQLCWTKGMRHKTSLKKMAESKKDIYERVLMSPDIADGFVLRFSRVVTERLLDNFEDHSPAGQRSNQMPEPEIDYDMGVTNDLYGQTRFGR